MFHIFICIYREAYENCVVLESRVCYNVTRLMYLNSERYQLWWFVVCDVCESVCARTFWIASRLLTQLFCCMLQGEDGAEQEIFLTIAGQGASNPHDQP